MEKSEVYSRTEVRKVCTDKAGNEDGGEEKSRRNML
jgi:hypothetical protein